MMVMPQTERRAGFYWRQDRRDWQHWVCLGVILCLATGCVSLYVCLQIMSSNMKNYRRIFQTEMENVMSREYNMLDSITQLNLQQENSLKRQMASVENLISQVEVLLNDIEIVSQMFRQSRPRSVGETDTLESCNELPELIYKAEHARRRIETIIGELWYFVNDQLDFLHTVVQFDNDEVNSYQDGEEPFTEALDTALSFAEEMHQNQANLSGENDNTEKVDSRIGVNSVTDVSVSKMGANYTSDKSGSKMGANSSDKSGSTMGANSSYKSGSKIRANSSDKSDSKMGANYTSEKSDSKMVANYTSDKSDSKMGASTRDKSDSKMGASTSDKSDSKMGANSSDKSDSKMGASTRDKSDSKMGANSSDKSDSKMGANYTSDISDSKMGANYTSDKADIKMGANYTSDISDSKMGANYTSDKADIKMGANYTSDKADIKIGANTSDISDSNMGVNYASDILYIFKNTIQGKLSLFQQELVGYRRTLLGEFDRFKRVDQADKRRLMMSKELGNVVQNRLEDLQNPKECKYMRTVTCETKSCGFGCQFHHMMYCLFTTYAKNQTVRFKLPPEWSMLFEPVSKTCEYTGQQNMGFLASPFDKTNTLHEKRNYADNVAHENVNSIRARMPRFMNIVPYIEYLGTIPDYIPLSVPEDLAPILATFHGNPAVWWVGQIASFLFKPTRVLKDYFSHVKRKIGFQNPIVGVQVRRTDKINSEASFHSLEEYMRHVEDYYDQLQRSSPNVVRRVFLATDDQDLLSEATDKYPNYIFISDDNDTRIEMRLRGTVEGIKGVAADIYFLSRSDFLVCTFSSQVCRLAYELMQTLHGDASQYFRSLDDIYYFGGQDSHKMTALEPHKADRNWPGTIDIMKGDTVSVQGNHWNGFSKGTNERTGVTGLYPSYKVEDHISTFKTSGSSGINVKLKRKLKANWSK